MDCVSKSKKHIQIQIPRYKWRHLVKGILAGKIWTDFSRFLSSSQLKAIFLDQAKQPEQQQQQQW